MVTDTRPGGPVATVVLPVSLQEAWEYFRDPALIRLWHGWEYDDLDHEIAEIYGSATYSEDHRTINVGTHFFNLFDDGDRTRVEAHRSPPTDDPESRAWGPYLLDIDEGWTSFLEQLRFMLARHPGDRRRTVFYGGAPKDPTTSLGQSLGLARVLTLEPGTAYRTSVGPGDALTGSVWFVTAHQVGVTVDAWGDGLLVVADGPHGGPPYTQGQAILTSYRLDDTAHQDLVTRWTHWWRDHYESGRD